MKSLKNGSVDSSQTVKAGCGIRFDPEQMSESCGFDFSSAEEIHTDIENKSDSSNEAPNSDNPPKETRDSNPKSTNP